MTTYGWQIVIWAVAGVVLVRLGLAPYWIWKEQQKHIVKLEEQLTPRLATKFDPNDPQYVSESPLRGPNSEERTCYVAVKPFALTDKPVKNCVGYLNAVYRLGPNGEWIQTSYTHRLQLEWGMVKFVKLDIDPWTDQVLNVFRVSETEPRIVPLVASTPFKSEKVFDNKDDVFRFDIVVIGDDCPPAKISLRAQRGEVWNDIKVSQI